MNPQATDNPARETKTLVATGCYTGIRNRRIANSRLHFPIQTLSLVSYCVRGGGLRAGRCCRSSSGSSAGRGKVARRNKSDLLVSFSF